MTQCNSLFLVQEKQLSIKYDLMNNVWTFRCVFVTTVSSLLFNTFFYMKLISTCHLFMGFCCLLYIVWIFTLRQSGMFTSELYVNSIYSVTFVSLVWGYVLFHITASCVWFTCLMSGGSIYCSYHPYSYPWTLTRSHIFRPLFYSSIFQLPCLLER